MISHMFYHNNVGRNSKKKKNICILIIYIATPEQIEMSSVALSGILPISIGSLHLLVISHGY